MNVLETLRLRLRPFGPADFAPLWAIWSEPAVREHLITTPEAISDFERMFTDMSVHSAAGSLWVVTDRGGRVLGRAGFYRYADQAPEFAILLTQTSWGAGLATEAARACLRHGFSECHWSEVVAVTRPANSRVLRVLAKLGFAPRSESEIRGKAVVWVALTADEWAKRGNPTGRDFAV
jgi:RimJ/RimL family protein N-acetyltransferase